MRTRKKITSLLSVLFFITAISCTAKNDVLEVSQNTSSESSSLISDNTNSSSSLSNSSSSSSSSSSVSYVEEEEELSYTEYVIDGETFYGIDAPQEFLAMENNKNYLLEVDLDFYGITIESIGDFSGIFDGNGYSLCNLYTSAPWPADSSFFGLFKTLSGTIRNVAFENIQRNATITPANPNNGMIYNSGLIAQTLTGMIENVYIRGSFIGFNTCWTPWADYREWLDKEEYSGIIAANGEGATINNVIVNVEYEERYDADYTDNNISLLVGRGKVNLGNYFVVKKNERTNVAWGRDKHRTMRDTWHGIDELENMISIMKDCLDSSIWNTSTNSMPMLNVDCSL